jgi:hypothetical protein
MDHLNNMYLNEISTRVNLLENLVFLKENKKNKTIPTIEMPNVFISNTKEKIETIQSLQINISESELIDTLNLLQNHLYISGWKTTVVSNPIKKLENKWNNKLSNIILIKFNKVLELLEINFPENNQIEDFKFLSKKLSFKKFAENFGLF